MLDIVEEHFDELDFLWEHREANVFTPDWTLHNLAEHEERVEAHLDGLRLAELHAVDLALDRISGGKTSAAAASTFVLCDTGRADFLEVVLTQLRGEKVAIVDGVRSALRHSSIDSVRATLEQIANAGPIAPAAAAIDVLAFHHHQCPPLSRFHEDEAPWVRVLALGAGGRLRNLRDEDLASALEHPEPIVRRAALYAAARSGVPALARRCRIMATRGTDPDADALTFLGVLGDERDLSLLQDAVRRADLAEAAIAGVGAMGSLAGIPWLIELMADEALGVFATAAYRRITGAEHVEGARPFPPAPVGEGEDEQEALPPDPEKAAADWKKRSRTMTTDRAWQSGVPVDQTALSAEFDRLTLEARRDVFARLRNRNPATAPDVELEALAVRQQRA